MANEKKPVDTGGPAYPEQEFSIHDGIPIVPLSPGRTLLDHFAGQALAGLLANPKVSGSNTDYARTAYRYASNMISEKRIVEGGGRK